LSKKASSLNQIAVTLEQNAVMSELKAVASEQKAVMSEQKAVMSEQKAVMSEQNAVMSEQKAVTSEQKAVMSEQNAVMSELKAVTSEQKALMSEQKDLTSKLKDLILNEKDWFSVKKTIPRLFYNPVKLTVHSRLCLIGALGIIFRLLQPVNSKQKFISLERVRNKFLRAAKRVSQILHLKKASSCYETAGCGFAGKRPEMNIARFQTFAIPCYPETRHHATSSASS
jgi:hypothetical protein